MDTAIEFLFNKLWVVIAAYFWYDKQKVDTRIKDVEQLAAKNGTESKLVDAKLDGIKDILEVRLEAIKEDVTDIKSNMKRGV